MNQSAEQLIEKHTINGCKPINSESMATYSADELIEAHDSVEKPYQFQPGNSIGAAGRPKGSRNKLSEAFLADVNALWLTHGNQALQDMLADSPTKFCQMVSLTVPKSLDIDQIDSVTWVINASPRLTNLEWQEQHNLIEQDTGPTETA